jgi:hypothetical protein
VAATPQSIFSASLFEVVRTKVPMPLYENNRSCTKCGRTEVTRHTCLSCPCNFCKKEGHIADNCERLKRRKEKSSRPVGRFADRNPASGGPLSNPSSIAPKKNQLRLPPRRNADVAAGSGAVATSSADGGGSRGTNSDSPGRDFSQRLSALDTSLSLKRKMEPESENARKKSTATPTTLIPDVSPLLDAEVGYPERIGKLQVELIVEFRLSDLDASRPSRPSSLSWSLLLVRKLRQEKVQKNFFAPTWRKTAMTKCLLLPGSMSHDNPEESSDEPASIMEISLDIADEPKIVITEAHDTTDSQPLDNSEVKGSSFQKPWRGWKFYHDARRSSIHRQTPQWGLIQA